MVADVVAAPEGDVVADRGERLHDVVLQDEAVLADLGGINVRGWMDEGCEAVAARLAFEMPVATKLVHATVAQRADSAIECGGKCCSSRSQATTGSP